MYKRQGSTTVRWVSIGANEAAPTCERTSTMSASRSPFGDDAKTCTAGTLRGTSRRSPTARYNSQSPVDRSLLMRSIAAATTVPLPSQRRTPSPTATRSTRTAWCASSPPTRSADCAASSNCVEYIVCIALLPRTRPIQGSHIRCNPTSRRAARAAAEPLASIRALGYPMVVPTRPAPERCKCFHSQILSNA